MHTVMQQLQNNNMFCVLCVALYLVPSVLSFPNSDCGKLKNKNSIPWTIGVYMEKQKDHLELICLGSIINNNYIITASQCVCETFSGDIRKETIFVSKTIEKRLKKDSNTIKIARENILKPKEYEGFLLNPIGDISLIKTPETFKADFVCVDWSDLRKNNLQEGILPIWQDNLKPIEASFLDYDICTSTSGSDYFLSILKADKNCYKTTGPPLDPQTIGGGIYHLNPKNYKWYIEGVVSGSESVNKDSSLVAVTSIRRYLAWLSRVTAS